MMRKTAIPQDFTVHHPWGLKKRKAYVFIRIPWYIDINKLHEISDSEERGDCAFCKIKKKYG